MKKADFTRLETLEALIAEKRKQETFLAKLEERRAGTPEHVFKRLQDEYLTKLTDAQVRAAAEAETLSGGLEEDDAAVAEVQAKLAQLEEERLEMQLRAEVEDWDAKETQKKLTAMTASISMAEKERDARTAVAERTRSLLSEARGGTPGRGQAAVSGPPVRPPMRPTTAGMAAGPNFDELAFLNSVVGRPSTPTVPAPSRQTPSVPAPSVPAVAVPASAMPEAPAAESAASPLVPASPAQAPAPAVVPAPQPAQPSLELEPPKPAPAPVVAEKLSEPASAPAPTPVTEKAPEPVSAAPVSAPAVPAAVVPTAPAPVAAAPVPDPEDEEPPSALGRPTPRTTQAVKTLKCAECGSMNYPTEWYCERCGGELAAL